MADVVDEKRAAKVKALLESAEQRDRHADDERRKADEERWEAAQLAYEAVDVAGEKPGAFAKSIGRTTAYVYDMRTTWKKFGKDRRGLSYWGHRDLAEGIDPARSHSKSSRGGVISEDIKIKDAVAQNPNLVAEALAGNSKLASEVHKLEREIRAKKLGQKKIVPPTKPNAQKQNALAYEIKRGNDFHREAVKMAEDTVVEGNIFGSDIQEMVKEAGELAFKLAEVTGTSLVDADSILKDAIGGS